MKSKQNLPRIEDALNAYFVTVWLLFGAFLLYAVFALPVAEFSPQQVMGGIPNFLLAVLFLPLLVVVMGVFAFCGYWGAGNHFLAFTSFFATFAFYALWGGIWYALYGRKRW